eukprot:s2644_g1.t1
MSYFRNPKRAPLPCPDWIPKSISCSIPIPHHCRAMCPTGPCQFDRLQLTKYDETGERYWLGARTEHPSGFDQIRCITVPCNPKSPSSVAHVLRPWLPFEQRTVLPKNSPNHGAAGPGGHWTPAFHVEFQGSLLDLAQGIAIAEDPVRPKKLSRQDVLVGFSADLFERTRLGVGLGKDSPGPRYSPDLRSYKTCSPGYSIGQKTPGLQSQTSAKVGPGSYPVHRPEHLRSRSTSRSGPRFSMPRAERWPRPRSLPRPSIVATFCRFSSEPPAGLSAAPTHLAPSVGTAKSRWGIAAMPVETKKKTKKRDDSEEEEPPKKKAVTKKKEVEKKKTDTKSKKRDESPEPPKKKPVSKKKEEETPKKKESDRAKAKERERSRDRDRERRSRSRRRDDRDRGRDRNFSGSSSGMLHTLAGRTTQAASGTRVKHLMYLTPFSSAASVASSLAGAAYEGLLGPDGEGRQKGALHDAAAAAERAQQMAIHLAEMLVFARTDLDTALTPGAHVVRGIREVGYRATQVFQRLRSTTLEFLSLEGSSSNAELLDLSRQLWQSWHAKHEALTAAERLYSTLLSESRRVGALTAELSCVTSLVDEEGDAAQSSGPCQVSGTAALERCQAQIRAQAAEAIQAFKDRAKDYPCGSPHPQTGLLRIARTEEDLRSICEAFSASVLEQETELLTQVEELAVTTELRTLTSSLSRRVAFWEGQIEENWSQWSFQSGRFHEAQTGAVECWEQLRGPGASVMSEKLEAIQQKYPGVDVQSLPWPPDISHWTDRDLDVFVGSGGFIKPKRKSSAAPRSADAKVAGRNGADDIQQLPAELQESPMELQCQEVKVEPQEDLCGALRGKCRGDGGQRAFEVGAGARHSLSVCTGSVELVTTGLMSDGKESLVKRFAGDGQDAQKDYKRWKRWSRAYLNVQRSKGIPETALGSLLFTLLDGAALRAFDSISMDDIEADGGHQVIYDVLDGRFPEEAVHDRLGEVMDGIFDLKVERGESTSVFTGKARSAFAAAEVEGVKFPDVARGYLLMRFARLSPEKRAIVLAASRQSYSEADVAAALRTTFPDGLYTGKVTSIVAPVENEEAFVFDDETVAEHDEVLAAEGVSVEDFGDEPIEEQDAVDILMTWKQTRSQINKEKINRGLASNADIRKMEARVRCFKCKKVGHFSRNCPTRKGVGKGATSSASQSKANFVGMVRDEGAPSDPIDEIILVLQSWKDRPRDYWWVDGDRVVAVEEETADNAIDQIQEAYTLAVQEDQVENSVFFEPPSDDETDPSETVCHLVHPAGFGVVDTGCGRGVIGEETLKRHEQALKNHGLFVEELASRPHRFRYGNGSADSSHRRVQLPIFIKGREMRMRLHVVPGEVPLLISKRFLKSLGARLGLDSNELYLSAVGIKTQMVERADGSCQIDLLDLNAVPAVKSPEVDVLMVKAEMAEMVPRLDQKLSQADDGEVDGEDSEEEDDVRHVGVHCVFKGAERKELQRQIYDALSVRDPADMTIIEVFSPGRFAELASGFGFKSMGSFDYSDGWDWRKPIHRRRAEQIISWTVPDVLVLTPPCGPLSLLQNLNPMEKRRDPQAFIQEVEQAKEMVRWCLRLAERQLLIGKDYLFEASRGSGAWSLDKMREFVDTYHHPQVNVAACAVGLLDRGSKLPFGKNWRFMTSSLTVAAMLEPLVCQGCPQHQVVEGSSQGQLRSIQSQVYPKKLLRKILGGFAMQDQVTTACYPLSQATIQSPMKSEGRRRVEAALRKLHINLGHCSKADMLRILQHHGAQAEVLELVKAFSCDICKANQAPKAVRDSAPPRDLAPLRYIGIDVKWLPSWKPQYKIRALNIVCRASGLQHMYPFREGEQECSELLVRLYRQWTRSYGRPRYCKFDAGRCNLGQTFLDCLERDGTTPLDVPGEAHEQMGDVESQGQHFEQMLVKVIQELNPKTYPEWVECVDSTVEARNMLMKRHGYSAYQLVFGRDPEIPGDDLLSSNPNVIANSAILEDAIAEFAHSTRIAAKQAEWSGEFCGSSLRQDPQSYEIVVSQEEFAEKLTKPKLRLREEPSMQVNDEEVTSLRFQIQAIVDCKSIYDHLQNFSSPGSVTDKRVAIDLVIVKETLSRVHGVIRWCPTWLQLADALTKESQEAMDVLRGAIVSKKYHLHAESTVMDAAAEQRQRRLAKRQEPSASVSAQGSQVLCVQCCARDMVKVDAKGFDHSEVRALFEVMVSQCVESEESYEKHLTQNSTLCRARLAAKHVNSQKFRGEEALVTYAFHKSTGMITVSCGAVFVDEAQKMLSEVLKIYKVVIKDGKIDPLPEGAQAWGRTLNYLMDKGIVSQYVLNQDAPSEGGKLEEAKERQMFVPKDEEFHAAVADLCGEVARKLHNYPAWRNSLLQVLLRDYGANPGQVIELSGLAEQYDLTQDDLTWDSFQEVDQPMAQAKAKSASFKGRAGYRGQI